MAFRFPAVGAVRHASWHLAIVTCIVAGASTAVHASPGALHETPAFSVAPTELLQLESLAGRTDAPAEILLDDTRYVFGEDGRHRVEFRRIFRLLSESGAERWRSLYAGYAPWLDEKPTITARVIAPDGTVRMLDPSAVLDGPEPPKTPDIVTDRRRVLAPLPPIAVGSVVEEVIRIVHKRPYFDAGTVQRVRLSRDVPTHLTRLRIESPSALPLKTRIEGFPSTEPDADGGTKAASRSRAEISIAPVAGAKTPRTIRTWTLRNLPAALTPEPGTPSALPRGASVAFSTGVSWNAVARAYGEIVDDKLAGAVTAGFTNGVNKPRANATHQERIDAAAEVLDRVRLVVRYTGVELGEAAVVPYTPAETLARGFGDCKDQAVVLVAALRALGMDASVALLSLAPAPDVSRDLPGLGLFNHAVVHVAASTNAPAFWIDSTRPFSDAGELPLQAQGRIALVTNPKHPELVVTPQSSSDDNTYVEVRTIHLSEVGAAHATETTRAYGSLRSTLRGFFESKPDRALKAKFRDYVRAEYGADDILAIDRPPISNPRDPFLMHLEMGAASKYTVDAEGASIAIHPRMAWSFLPGVLQPQAPASRRRTAFHFKEPHRAEIVYRLFLPRGFDWEATPPSLREQVGDAVVERRVTMAKEGALEVRYVVDTGSGDLSASTFQQFRRALARLSTEGPARLKVIHRGQRAIEDGRVKEGLAIYRALLGSGPNPATHHERFADALLAVGLGESARHHAQQAVEKEPASGAAWAALGWVLLHDSLGRKLAPGFDRTGAIAAFRRAIALRPNDPQIQANLAVALEVGDAGAAYGIGADVDGAIEAYEQRRALTGERDYDVNLMRAYFRSHRFKDIVELAPKVKRSPASDSLYLGAIAALEGPDQALERAEWLIEAPAVRREAIEVAGDVLPLVGKYKEAAVLLRAAVRGSRDPKRLMVRAKILADTRGYEACSIGGEHPAGAAVSAWYRALYQLDKPAPLAALLRGAALGDTRPLTSVREEADRSALLVDTLARRALPARILLDAALCTTRADILEKRASVVVNVRPKAFGTKGMFPAPDHDWYFALDRRNGKIVHRLVAVVREGVGVAPASDFGHEALALAKRGNLLAATEWLDHAYRTWRAPDGDALADALATPAFVRLWGGSTTAERKSRAFVTNAAALLVATGAMPTVGVPLVQRALTSAQRQASRGVDQARVFHAFLEGNARQALTLANKKAAVVTTARLLSALPQSRTAYILHNGALWRANDLDGLRARAEERLSSATSQDLAVQTLSSVELANGEFDSADTRLRLLAEADGHIRSQCYNHLAWSSLFRDAKLRELEGALDDAEAATRALKRPTPAALQTLATVYAMLDRPKEAVSTLTRAVDARPTRTLIREDYFVMGRVAESYGLTGEARVAYARVEPQTDATLDAFDAWRLAQVRLAKLPARSTAPRRLKQLASPSERSLLEDIDRLRQASDAATSRATPSR